jgi:membrane-bound ClpP family serine protease
MTFEFFHAYMILFFIGFIYALISAILSGVLGGDFDGGHDFDLGDPSLHLEPGMVDFSPLSPTIIATFLAVFGGTGMICIKVFEMSNYGSIPVALAVGLGVSTVIFFAMEWIFRKTQGSTNIESARLIGAHADVITPIPAGGVGEIAYVIRGTRQNAPARSADGKAIEGFAEVEIIRIVGSSFIVRRVAADEQSTEPPSPEE